MYVSDELKVKWWKEEAVAVFLRQVRFQVLTATSMKMAVSWNGASCSLVEIGRPFRGAYCLHH
jgi:hypothetical protein